MTDSPKEHKRWDSWLKKQKEAEKAGGKCYPYFTQYDRQGPHEHFLNLASKVLTCMSTQMACLLLHVGPHYNDWGASLVILVWDCKFCDKLLCNDFHVYSVCASGSTSAHSKKECEWTPGLFHRPSTSII